MKVAAAILRALALLGAALCAAAAPLAAWPMPAWVNPFVTLYGSLYLSEWGHVLAVAPLLIAAVALLLRRGHPRQTIATLALALFAAGLFLTPAAEAWQLGRRLPAQLEAAFGPAAVAARPFSVRALFAPPPATIAPERLRFAGGRLPLDFYRAAGPGPAPCVIILHGGGWFIGSRREGRPFDAWLARRGYAVAAVEYTLAPERPWPAAFSKASPWLQPTLENRSLPHALWPAPREDVARAIAFLRARAALLGIDPTRFVLLGRSAGAQLAEAAAYSQPDPGIRGVIGFYGPTDFPAYFTTYAAGPFAAVNRFFLLQLLGQPYAAIPETYREASPLWEAQAGAPPTLLLNGGRDCLIPPSQADELSARLAALGVPHAVVLLPWATHGSDLDLRTPSGQVTAYAVAQFLAAVTR
jgi:acetyl esterase/lipase